MVTEVKRAVEAQIAEIDSALKAIEPQHEGLRNYARLDIQDETRREIQDAIEDYDRRVQLLGRARDAYVALLEAAASNDTALINDGHPSLPERQISPAALADLQSELDETMAARKLFVQQATNLGLKAGKTEPK